MYLRTHLKQVKSFMCVNLFHLTWGNLSYQKPYPGGNKDFKGL